MNRDHQSQCGGCGGDRRWVLHNVRHRAAYRRLCTNCILKTHQGLFCPFCFQVFEESLPPKERLMCLKCPSISHLSCVPCSHPHSPPSFLCPPCSTPNFSFFNLDSSSTNDNTNSGRPIDKDSARALVAAAKIAAVSMTKAAAVARVEAERRVKEAALAKKRAREALERLAFLAAKEKETKGAVKESAQQQHKFSNNNNKRILVDGMIRKEQSRNGAVQTEKGSDGIYSVSSVVNASATAGQLKR
ncbi:hypothetical protein P3X46_005800 [Hevea brasiliensis]|uniref:RING-type domain-containing protein n=1 Tax=Hevea brasiliensis TaxID=3981 RepID=A0ABQ9MQM0_HEVBR|nr:uncharacterized protein LOC110635264 [Hevea brasiliensis]KAJ9181737.1 hypothetical protein P3X46_005800 [Hevea brasiliensis]